MDVYALNKKFETITVVDSYESLIWTDRYDEYGDFEIVISPTSSLMDHLTVGNYLWRKDSEHVMMIKTVKITTSAVEAPRVIISGKSLESILCDRVIASQTIINSNLQNGIQKLINDAIINPSNPNRKISNFIFKGSSSKIIGELNLDAQYFGENLYDVIAEICASEHIGFKVTLNSNYQFVFELYTGTDRSYDQTENPYVVFSPHYDNLINSEYLHDISDIKNAACVAGEDEQEETSSDGTVVAKHPQVVVDIGSSSGLDRREIFVNASNLKMSYRDSNNNTVWLTKEQYASQLQEKGKEELAEYYSEKNFDGEVESSLQWTLGKDFFMGDIVQIENEYGMSAKSRVVEMITSHDTSGLSFYPSFEIVE